MPQQRAGQPVAKRDLPREDKGDQGRRVVYLPAGSDHHQCRQGIDPVTDAYPARVNCRAGLRRGDRSGGHYFLVLMAPLTSTARSRLRMLASINLAEFQAFIPLSIIITPQHIPISSALAPTRGLLTGL